MKCCAYGRDGVDNLGIVSGLGPYRMLSSNPADVPGAIDARLGPNFNAADIDPVTGIMYLASFQTGGALNRLYRIDVTQTPPQYLSTLTLTAPISRARSQVTSLSTRQVNTPMALRPLGTS